jgi:hypothetical protein
MKPERRDEMACAFARAELSTHPDLGFIALRLIRFDPDPPHPLLAGELHRLRPEQVADLIGHLQSALMQYRSSLPPALHPAAPQ